MDQAVEPVRDPPVTYDDDPDAADAARALVGCLEIYRREISHLFRGPSSPKHRSNPS